MLQDLGRVSLEVYGTRRFREMEPILDFPYRNQMRKITPKDRHVVLHVP